MMHHRKKSGIGKPLKVSAVLLGILMTVMGALSASGTMNKLLEHMGAQSELISAAETIENLPAWFSTVIALIGLLIIGGVLNGVECKKVGSSAVKSRLIRRPIQRLFIVFVAPTFAAFSISFIYPFIKGLFLSFCRFKTTNNWTWIGFDNYINAFRDPSFIHSFWYTVLFAVVSLIVINVLAFAAAYALTRGIPGTNVFRTVLFMPNLIGGIVLGYIWGLLFDTILSRYGTSILLRSEYGFWGLQILTAWQQIGYMMIIYIVGIQSVPEDILEASKIDGAGSSQTLFKITIPNVMPSVTICTFLTLTNSFKLFDQNLALTAGRPIIQDAGAAIKSTEMLALNIYNSLYASTSNRGLGQSKAVIFFIIVALISIVQLSVNRKRETQQ